MEVTFLAALSCVGASEGERGQMHKRKAGVDNDKQLVRWHLRHPAEPH